MPKLRHTSLYKLNGPVQTHVYLYRQYMLVQKACCILRSPASCLAETNQLNLMTPFLAATAFAAGFLGFTLAAKSSSAAFCCCLKAFSWLQATSGSVNQAAIARYATLDAQMHVGSCFAVSATVIGDHLP